AAEPASGAATSPTPAASTISTPGRPRAIVSTPAPIPTLPIAETAPTSLPAPVAQNPATAPVGPFSNASLLIAAGAIFLGILGLLGLHQARGKQKKEDPC